MGLPHPTLLRRQFVNQYCDSRNLGGTVDLLHALVKGEPRDFESALRKEVHNVSPLSQSTLLFHGSRQFQNSLVPRVSTGGTNEDRKRERVYATDDPNYAIFLAVIDLREGGSASVEATNDHLRLCIDLGFVNGRSRFSKGYVHVVDGALFQKKGNHEFTATAVVPTLFAIEVSPKDLTERVIVTLR